MNKETLYVPKILNKEKVNKMVKKLNSTITAALDKACPIIDSKIVNKNNPWWTDQLTQMRKELYSIYDKSKLHPDNLSLYKT